MARATAAARARMRVRVPLLAVGAAAWLTLAAQAAGAGPGPPHAAHVMRASAWSLVGQAALMVAAMMVPLLGAPLGHVRERSLARRRRRAAVLFVSAYALPWVAATVVLLGAARWIAASRSPFGWSLALLAAAIFQASPQKQRFLNRCHGHPPLAPFGAGADLAVVRFGLSHAWWCIGSCFALMLLPMLVPHGHLTAMAGVTLWLAGERIERPVQPRWRWRVPGRLARVALSQGRVLLAWFASDAGVPRALAADPGSLSALRPPSAGH